MISRLGIRSAPVHSVWFSEPSISELIKSTLLKSWTRPRSSQESTLSTLCVKRKSSCTWASPGIVAASLSRLTPRFKTQKASTFRWTWSRDVIFWVAYARTSSRSRITWSSMWLKSYAPLSISIRTWSYTEIWSRSISCLTVKGIVTSLISASLNGSAQVIRPRIKWKRLQIVARQTT